MEKNKKNKNDKGKEISQELTLTVSAVVSAIRQSDKTRHTYNRTQQYATCMNCTLPAHVITHRQQSSAASKQQLQLCSDNPQTWSALFTA